MLYLFLIVVNIASSYLVPQKNAYITIINPIFWILLSIILFIFTPNKHVNSKKDKKAIQFTFIITIFYIILFFLSGILETYGKNPYSRTIKGFLMNFWTTGVFIIGREYVRCKILSKLGRKKHLILVIIVFSILELDVLDVFNKLNTAIGAFKIIISKVLPITIKNILFVKIASKYSYKSPIVYDLSINMFYWLSPILPNAPWILVSILDIVSIFIIYTLIENNIPQTINDIRTETTDSKQTIVYVSVILLLSCFIIGIFPIQIRAVATGSMYPEILVGDAVIIKKCGINDIKMNDIVEYQIENQYVIHRVVEIENEDEISFITKGDNNRSNDSKKVTEKQLIGKVIFKIKYIGWPSVLLHNLFQGNDEILVETGK